jgi:sulfur carrier protein ThiS
MPVVIVPEAYRGPTQGIGQVEVKADTIRGCLEAVEAQHPGFLPLVLDAQGRQHRFVKLFVNQEQLDSDALDRPIDEQDRLEVLAAIAGG